MRRAKACPGIWAQSPTWPPRPRPHCSEDSASVTPTRKDQEGTQAFSRALDHTHLPASQTGLRGEDVRPTLCCLTGKGKGACEYHSEPLDLSMGCSENTPDPSKDPELPAPPHTPLSRLSRLGVGSGASRGPESVITKVRLAPL